MNDKESCPSCDTVTVVRAQGTTATATLGPLMPCSMCGTITCPSCAVYDVIYDIVIVECGCCEN